MIIEIENLYKILEQKGLMNGGIKNGQNKQ